MLGSSRSARVALGLFVVLSAASCMRVDQRVAQLAVPGMTDARDVRIVTNAALNEAVGRYEGPKNDYEVDVGKGLVLYHESSRLLDAAYRGRIEACLRQVGYEGRFLSVRFNPPPPVPTIHGPVQIWPDRYTAVLHVPALKSSTGANVVVDAIAYARTGDHPAVTADTLTRALRVAYNGRRLSLKNLETAIAGAGYAVNGTRANLGRPDALALGWSPVTIQPK
jgi:hypothetical protein